MKKAMNRLFSFRGYLSRREYLANLFFITCILFVFSAAIGIFLTRDSILTREIYDQNQLFLFYTIFISVFMLLTIASASIRRINHIGGSPWTIVLLSIPYVQILMLIALLLLPGGTSYNNFLSDVIETLWDGIKKLPPKLLILFAMFVPFVAKLGDNTIKPLNDVISPALIDELKPGAEASIIKPILSSKNDYKFIELDLNNLKSEEYRKNVIDSHGTLFYKSSESSEDAINYLHATINKPRLIFATPHDDDSIRNMYGKNLNDADLKNIKTQMNKLNVSLQNIDINHSPPDGSSIGMAHIIDLVKKGDNDAVIVVGHTKGSGLILPNGEAMSISEIHLLAENYNKRVLVISCNSFNSVDSDFSGVVSIDRLNYESIVDGVNLAEKTRCNTESCMITLSEYIYNLDAGISLNIETNKRKNIRVKLVLVSTTSSVAVGGFVLIEKDS